MNDNELQQNQGPSEVVMKLVLPYLDWEELLKTGDLVCKSWRDVLLGDDVWRPICDDMLKVSIISFTGFVTPIL